MQHETTPPLLTISDLVVTCTDTKKQLLNHVSLTIRQGETVALVGESGSGKTMTASAILSLFPSPAIAITQGSIYYAGEDLCVAPQSSRKKILGKEIAFVPQNPLNALNPTCMIGKQLTEAIPEVPDARAKALELLRLVGIPHPELRFYSYPHELSGGMRQRVLIAMSLIKHPKLLIADEPTTALDVTVQSEILSLIKHLQAMLNMGLLFITHDFGIVAEIADRIAVMYHGRIVEEGSVYDLFASPQHPYTRMLLESIPSIETLTIPAPIAMTTLRCSQGCPFAPRCTDAMHVCANKVPPQCGLTPNHTTSCWKYYAKTAS